MTDLKVRPFSHYEKDAKEIPSIIEEYINASDEIEGSKFNLKNGGKSVDTGDGMSYYDRLMVSHSDKPDPIYDTGFQLWRPGQAFTTNKPWNSINGVKLLKEDNESVVFGYKDGTGKIFIKECDLAGNVSLVKKFDMSAHEEALESKKEPKNSEEFKYPWVGNNVPKIGGASWHYDIYHDDEDICVVVARHCSRSVDATHDYFQVFVWEKGQGVAVSEMYPTYGKASTTKFSTNYLGCKVTIGENGEIFLKGKSEFGDVKVEKTFQIS
ncbi:MAG: hypothetical protein WD552_00595 [Candidatus Paceibacterota bacterium]